MHVLGFTPFSPLFEYKACTTLGTCGATAFFWNTAFSGHSSPAYIFTASQGISHVWLQAHYDIAIALFSFAGQAANVMDSCNVLPKAL